MLYILTPLPFPNILLKTACRNSKQYNSYDYSKKAYKHDAEHDVAKTSQFLEFLMSIWSVFLKRYVLM